MANNVENLSVDLRKNTSDTIWKFYQSFSLQSLKHVKPPYLQVHHQISQGIFESNKQMYYYSNILHIMLFSQQGFLQTELVNQTLDKLTRKIQGITEDFMKTLESLDSLVSSQQYKSQATLSFQPSEVTSTVVAAISY